MKGRIEEERREGIGRDNMETRFRVRERRGGVGVEWKEGETSRRGASPSQTVSPAVVLLVNEARTQDPLRGGGNEPV